MYSRRRLLRTARDLNRGRQEKSPSVSLRSGLAGRNAAHSMIAFRRLRDPRLGVAIAILLSLATSIGCSSSAIGNADTKTRLAAEQILEDMSQAYRQAKTYADSGELHLHFNYGGDKQVDERVDFSVSFARPNKLRMHCYQAIVVSDGDKLQATIADLPNQVLSVKAPDKLALDGLYSDEALRQALTAQIAGSSPQIALLVDENFLPAVLKDAQPPQLLEPAEIEGDTCDRVQVTSAAGNLVFWINQQSHVLMRIDFPTNELKQNLEQQVGGPVTNLQLWADLKSGSLDRPIEDIAFEFETPAEAKLVDQFDLRALMPAPPAPSKLLGQQIGEFTFEGLDGAPVTRESLAGKVVVVDFWATWCGPCMSSLPNLDTVYQKFKDDDRIRFLAVSIDQPDVPAQKITDTLQGISVTIPVARDNTQSAFKAFQVEGIPNLFVVGPDGVVQDNEVGLNPEAAAELPARLEKLLAGESIHADALKRYEDRKAQYEEALKQPLPSASDAAEEPVSVKAEIAAKSDPEHLQLTPLWTAGQLERPGNIIAIPGEGGTRFFVLDGWRKVAELDDHGKIVAQHELKTPEMAVISFIRAARDKEGRLWFVGSASTQPQAHLFDENWNLIRSYPEAEKAEIGDVEFTDLNGDGTPELAISYWGGRGIEVVTLEGEPLWKNDTLENVFRLAQSPGEAGQQKLLATHSRGSVSTFSAEGAAGPEISVPQRFLRSLFVADLNDDGLAECLALSPIDQARDRVLGFDGEGKEQWTYELPPGLHEQPLEHVAQGRLTGDQKQWVVCAADGSIHILNADGAMFDRFNVGSAVGGLAIAEIGGKPALLIATDKGVTAYECSSK